MSLQMSQGKRATEGPRLSATSPTDQELPEENGLMQGTVNKNNWSNRKKYKYKRNVKAGI